MLDIGKSKGLVWDYQVSGRREGEGQGGSDEYNKMATIPPGNHCAVVIPAH